MKKKNKYNPNIVIFVAVLTFTIFILSMVLLTPTTTYPLSSYSCKELEDSLKSGDKLYSKCNYIFCGTYNPNTIFITYKIGCETKENKLKKEVGE